MQKQTFTKYEQARILGARALQVAMNAPLLIKIEKDDLERIKYDALKIAEIELESGVLPISIKRPMPDKKESGLKRVQERKIGDSEVGDMESEEEKDIMKEGEIMELANPDDEAEEEAEEESGED